MTDGARRAEEPDAGPDQRPDATARRRVDRDRRRDQVFGDVLDGSTLDDRPDPAARGEDPDVDRWLQENVPPHHGR